MIDLMNECEKMEISHSELICNFDWGDHDLNDFFNRDALHYQNERLGKTFFFVIRIVKTGTLSPLPTCKPPLSSSAAAFRLCSTPSPALPERSRREPNLFRQY